MPDFHKKYKITNDMQGFKKLTEWLESQGISYVKACMEATGRYGEKVAGYLYECGHDVHVINPTCIRTCKLTHSK
jgi:transposase